MSFLSVLKKVGQEVNKFDAQIPVFGPVIHGFTSLIPDGGKVDNAVTAGTGKVQDGLEKFQNIVLDIEAIGQAISLPGPQKAAATAPAINQLFLDLPILKGKKPKDAEQTKADAANLGGALAQYLNGFEG